MIFIGQTRRLRYGLFANYRIKTDKRSGINDPNRLDDKQYIVRLIKQVITISDETWRDRERFARSRLAKRLNEKNCKF